MKFAVIENNIVVNTVLADEPLAYNWIASEIAGIGDFYENGQFIKPQPAQPSPEEIQAEIVVAVVRRLNDFAQTRNYDDIKSACDYAGCSVAKFSVEGQYCKDKRAETWAKLYEILAEVQAGTRPMPTSFADVESELPALAWPQ